MGRMEPLSDLYHDNIIMPSAPRVLFRLLFRLPVKERGLSADAEGNAEDERDGGAEQTEAPGGTADGEHHAVVDPASAAAAADEPMAMPTSIASHAQRPFFSAQSAQSAK